ncbi:MAG: hypothetical protein AAGA90_20105 [Actinomycetota bacterium]
MERSLHLLGLTADQQTSTSPRMAADVAERIHQEFATRRPSAGLLLLPTNGGTEFYLDGTDDDVELLDDLISALCDGADDGLDPRFALIDDAAVAHLFRSAAGLESPILGDTQVLAELRLATERANRFHALSAVLAEAVDRSLALGNEVRRLTEIAAGRADIGGAIARAIGERGLTFSPVVLVGTDDIAARTLAAFSHAPRPVGLLARHPSEANVLADAFGASVLDVEQLHQWAGSVYVITTPLVPAAIRALLDEARLVIDVVPGGTSIESDLGLGDLSDWSDPRRLAAVVPAADLCDRAVAEWQAWTTRRPFEAAVGTLYRDLDRLVEDLEAGDAAVAVRSVVRRWLNPHVSALRDAVTPPSDPGTMQKAV